MEGVFFLNYLNIISMFDKLTDCIIYPKASITTSLENSLMLCLEIIILFRHIIKFDSNLVFGKLKKFKFEFKIFKKKPRTILDLSLMT